MNSGLRFSTSAMSFANVDWNALQRLRAAFLDGTAGRAAYWQSDRDLASYDATFAARIGWKWDHVLHELVRLGWTPPAGPVLDWGCGSGIAARRFLAHFAPVAGAEVWFSDQSSLAVSFAVKQARTVFPSASCHAGQPPRVGTLLVSHVLTELDARELDELTELFATAESVVWVEPGTHESSRRMIALRERLLAGGGWNVVAPCTHRKACGMLAAGNEPHWCHHFASPPPEVFMDAGWARFGEEVGVDLRSLPLSYLVLDRRPAAEMPEGAVRLIGRPRVYKPNALVFGCDATGVAERSITKRALPAEHRLAKKDRLEPLQIWRCDGAVVTELKALLPPVDTGDDSAPDE